MILDSHTLNTGFSSKTFSSHLTGISPSITCKILDKPDETTPEEVAVVTKTDTLRFIFSIYVQLGGLTGTQRYRDYLVSCIFLKTKIQYIRKIYPINLYFNEMYDENSENPLKYCFVIDNNKIWITDAYYSELSTHRKNLIRKKGSLIRLQ